MIPAAPLILAILGVLSPAPPSSETAPRVTDSISGIRLVWISPGSFDMGSPPRERDRRPDEILHHVSLTRGFWMGATEVTQGQWSRLMRNDPSYFHDCGSDCPVEDVTWVDVQSFLARLNRTSGGGFRLPTEAEWELACRAGSMAPFTSGNALSAAQANFDGSSPRRVGSYRPNRWGLFDMHGNVWEWCQDWYGPYEKGPATDPTGPRRGTLKVIRGGSWHFGEDSCRCALRYTHAPGDRGFSLGFRVARSPS